MASSRWSEAISSWTLPFRAGVLDQIRAVFGRRGMARALHAAALPQAETRQLPAAAALAALGIVYGDIGTSPLYAFKRAAAAGGTLSPDTILGIASLILWTLIVTISLKY